MRAASARTPPDLLARFPTAGPLPAPARTLKQALILRLDHPVTFAGTFLQCRTVEDGDGAVLIPEPTAGSHPFGGDRDSFTPYAEHITDELLRHAQGVAVNAVEAGEKPPTHLLLERVMAIA